MKSGLFQLYDSDVDIDKIVTAAKRVLDTAASEQKRKVQYDISAVVSGLIYT